MSKSILLAQPERRTPPCHTAPDSRAWLNILMLLLLILGACPAWAAAPVVLDPDVNKFPLGLHLEILPDPKGKLSIDQVSSPAFATKFSASKSLIPLFGFTDTAYWAKFALVNPLATGQSVLLEDAYPHIDDLQVFIRRGGEQVAHLRGGDALPFGNREVDHRNFIFKLNLPPQSTTQVFLRLKSESSMQIPLTIWRPVAFAEKVNDEQTVLGIYFGVMLAMLLYNLFLFIFLRDSNYLYYILYIAFFLLAQLGVNRMDFEYLWPSWPVLANLSHPIFFNLTFFFGGMFCRSFLNTRKRTPYLDKAILLMMAVCILGLILTLVSGYTAGIKCVVYFLATLGPVFMLAAGVRCWAKGMTTARYYTIAWSVFLVGAVVFNLRNMGILPSITIIAFSPHIGSAIEVILLSIALADRINAIKNEKFAAQAQAFTAEQALTEALERQVEERTSQVKALSGLLPICASCKKIRDDQGYWQQVEQYVGEHSDAVFSHSICPDCLKKLYPEVAQRVLEKKDRLPH